MSRIAFAAPLALCACLSSMQRAPKQIPADGVVECTDSLETPAALSIAALVGIGALAYAMTDMEMVIDTGGVMWAPVLALSVAALGHASVTGLDYASECRAAKQRGAEQAQTYRREQARASARAEAGALWKRAAAAARADDCETVRSLDPQIKNLDLEFHAVVFSRDVAIARCLVSGRL